MARQGTGGQHGAAHRGARKSPKNTPRIGFGESDQIEFKVQWADEALQSLASFANTRGGTVYVGVAVDGRLVGTDVSDGQQRYRGEADGIHLASLEALLPVPKDLDGRRLWPAQRGTPPRT